MPKETKKRPSPLSLRLTPDERAQLDRDAAGMAIGAYIRWRLFDPTNPPPKTRGKFPVKDHVALSQLLGQLGQSRIADNLNQLARLAKSGSLHITPEAEAAILAGKEELTTMRRLLMKTLGISARSP